MNIYTPTVGDIITIPSINNCIFKDEEIAGHLTRIVQCVVTDIRGEVRIEWLAPTIFTRSVVRVDDCGRIQGRVHTGGSVATLLKNSDTYDVLCGKTIQVVQGKVVLVARLVPFCSIPCGPTFDTVVYDYDLVEA